MLILSHQQDALLTRTVKQSSTEKCNTQTEIVLGCGEWFMDGNMSHVKRRGIAQTLKESRQE